VHDHDSEASALMERGLALMGEDRPGAASEALACFDQALAIRESLPGGDAPLVRYGLAACWLNRADALMRLGGGPQVAEAVRSCDESIKVLGTLPLESDTRFPRRLAMAHHNRALFLQMHGASLEAVAQAFEAARAVLASESAAAVDDRAYLLAVVWMNLASVLAAQGGVASIERARDAALQAIALVAGAEDEHPAAAEVGLKARHALCRSVAQRLGHVQPSPEEMPDDVHEATDAVDDGLALVRRWEQKGMAAFRGVACDLFRFGSRVYLMYQPQFLQEFLDDNLDPAASSMGYAQDAELRAAAEEIVELHAHLYSRSSGSNQPGA
jgi:hypothetical protein